MQIQKRFIIGALVIASLFSGTINNGRSFVYAEDSTISSSSSDSALSDTFGDYTVKVLDDLPQGTELSVSNVDSIENITSVLQAKNTENQTIIPYFTAKLSFTLNGETYQPAKDTRLEITGPLVRGEVTGNLILYQGTCADDMTAADPAKLTIEKTDFSWNNSPLLMIVDKTDQPVQLPVMPAQSIEKHFPVTNPDTGKDIEPTLQLKASASQAHVSKYINPNLPALRNQYPYGTCWAFASTALVETSVINSAGTNAATLAESIDLSELHLAYFTNNMNGYDPLGLTVGDTSHNTSTNTNTYLDSGGDYSAAMNTLLNWVGMTNETIVPYENASAVLANGLTNEYEYSKDQYHIQDVYSFDPTTEDGIAIGKEFIQENGSFGISFYFNSSDYSSTNNAYYCPADTDNNHAVAIVGWDDDFASSNFNAKGTVPEKNGAWLVRNSWYNPYFPEYSYYGYFWISYYDNSITEDAVSVHAELADNYDHNYHYDGGLYSSAVKAENSETSIANVFTAKGNSGNGERLKAVYVGLTSPNVNYTVKIYKNLTDSSNPESGTLVYQNSGSTETIGDYTIPLTTPVTLHEDTIFSVVFDLSCPSSQDLYFETENNFANSFSTVSCPSEGAAGRSFYKPNGTWVDFYTTMQKLGTGNTDIRVRAFTSDLGENPVIAFVKNLYLTTLDRQPDTDGLNYWVNELSSGMKTGAQVTNSFVFGKEFTAKNYCNEHFLTHLYKAIFSRDADTDGLNYWEGKMSAGLTREAVLNGFLGGQEFKTLCSNAGIEVGSMPAFPTHSTIQTWICPEDAKMDNGIGKFVLRMYTTCLARDAEKAGTVYWINQLNTNQIGGTAVVEQFFMGTEFTKKNISDIEYMYRLYLTIFNRDPDTSGINFWVNKLQNGTSRKDVLYGFTGGKEWATVCKQYGIIQ